MLCVVELWVVRSMWFPQQADLLALAVTVDLVAGIPCLCYLLLVRIGRSPAIVLAPVLVAAIAVANAARR